MKRLRSFFFIFSVPYFIFSCSSGDPKPLDVGQGGNGPLTPGSTEGAKLTYTDSAKLKYQLFAPPIMEDKVTSDAYLFSDNFAGKRFTMAQQDIKVENISIDKLTTNDGSGTMVLNATVDLSIGSTTANRIGFSRKIVTNKVFRDVSNLDNGCLTTDGQNLCLLEGIFEAKETKVAADAKEMQAGILEKTTYERIYLAEIDYDFESNQWNFVRMVYGVRELVKKMVCSKEKNEAGHPTSCRCGGELLYNPKTGTCDSL